ncbi:Flp pilus assembly protein CpaB, SAF domain [Modestobacter italicus]|uniref:Flp pilus assembly protein CpaB, SAF domain n=1 Tax=Modestobacter italicus (strain DSM 44449 / CECT 9708 / BC 501) TaxID=2732864 RepID=I4ESK8_MODI5|nr:Flp pilus assembly protein CpaB, SAF domain [Modestobacter marinus]
MRLLRQVTAGCLACLALALALRPPPAPAAAPATTPVVTAAADLAPGTVLAAGDLTAVAVPVERAPAGSVADPAELTGRVLASPVRAGEAVTDVRLVGPGLWSQVPAGEVAAPVRLADLAVATLLRAGDRVDVLGTTGDGELGAAPAVELVAQGALVLSAPAAAEPGAGVGSGTDSGLLVLAVPPDTARLLAAAGAGGTLTVTLGRP